MNDELMLERLLHALTNGDRDGARDLVRTWIQEGGTPEQLATGPCWECMEQISMMFRADKLTTLAHHYATRLLRTIVDQLQAGYDQQARREKSILVFTGPAEADELAGQLVSDLLEADGYEVFFAGGGIANDEILEEVGRVGPSTLLMFASGASDAPAIRQLIDSIRTIGAHPDMQIVVGGGVFNRAEGLAEEIGADSWATSPSELLSVLEAQGERRATAEQRTVGRNRRVGAGRSTRGSRSKAA